MGTHPGVRTCPCLSIKKWWDLNSFLPQLSHLVLQELWMATRKTAAWLIDKMIMAMSWSFILLSMHLTCVISVLY